MIKNKLLLQQLVCWLADISDIREFGYISWPTHNLLLQQ